VTDLPERLDDLARMLVGLPWFELRFNMMLTCGPFGDETLAFDRCIPDLSDPGTVGHLRAIVSELVGGPVSIRWVPHLVGGVWYAETSGALQARGPTEAHALIALALQVTP
jgi:hypothetical protein